MRRPMDATALPPLVVALDDCDAPADVIDALALGRFAAGAEPHAHSRYLHRVRPDAPLAPPGHEPAWSAEDEHRRATLVLGDGWTLRTVRWRSGTAELRVTATSHALAVDVAGAAARDALLPDAPEDAAVPVGFWYRRGASHARTERQVAIEPWPVIRRNYGRAAVHALDALMAHDPGERSGRLLLLHGPPGTGKTTALRALAHAWRRWCRMEVILDPERFFDDPGYIMEVTLGFDDEPIDHGQQAVGVPDPPRRWRLLVLEDCDELLQADAKRRTGQALARLLNLTDGLIGQGLAVLVALTTNEPLASLHPAVVRPGRCLAEIHVDGLNACTGWARRIGTARPSTTPQHSGMPSRATHAAKTPSRSSRARSSCPVARRPSCTIHVSCGQTEPRW
jgi:hypothetical protein